MRSMDLTAVRRLSDANAMLEERIPSLPVRQFILSNLVGGRLQMKAAPIR